MSGPPDKTVEMTTVEMAAELVRLKQEVAAIREIYGKRLQKLEEEARAQNLFFGR